MISPQSFLKKYQLRPSKRRGQNFLINSPTSQAIIEKASLQPEDIVIEVGTGLGILSIPLAAKVKRVLSFEIDPRLIAAVQKEYDLPPNLEITCQDILQVDFEKLARDQKRRLKIIGNLPYCVSSPVLFKVWEARSLFEDAFFMVQKEVADRILARPGGKQYGVLSALLHYGADIARILDVAANQFYPRPAVDSTVVAIHFRDPHVLATDEAMFKKTVKTAFQQRRKTLQNALSGKTGFSPQHIREALNAIEIDGMRRPETLEPDDFVRLSNLLASTP